MLNIINSHSGEVRVRSGDAAVDSLHLQGSEKTGAAEKGKDVDHRSIHVSEPTDFTGRMLTSPARPSNYSARWFFKITEPGSTWTGQAAGLPRALVSMCWRKLRTERTQYSAVTSRFRLTLIRCFVNSPLSTLFSMSLKLERCWRRSFFARYLLHSVDSFFSSAHRPSNPSPSKSCSACNDRQP